MKAIFFDLDGTLVDSAEDLIDAIQYALDLNNTPRQALYPYVSRGFRGLYQALDADKYGVDYDQANARFLDYYQANIARSSCFYPSMDEMLLELQDKQVWHGIVTNKHQHLADCLMAELLPQWQGVLVGADGVSPGKAAPDLLFKALKQAENKYQQQAPEAENIYYVGDYPTDTEAAHNAGWVAVIAAYGYLPEDKPIETWQAEHSFDCSIKLTDWVRKTIR